MSGSVMKVGHISCPVVADTDFGIPVGEKIRKYQDVKNKNSAKGGMKSE